MLWREGSSWAACLNLSIMNDIPDLSIFTLRAYTCYDVCLKHTVKVDNSWETTPGTQEIQHFTGRSNTMGISGKH